MSDNIEVGSPIKDYIQSVMSQIKDAQSDDIIVGGLVEIEMSTILENEKGKRLDIRVLDIGAKVSENHVHKIKIPLRLVTPAYEKIREAKMAAAEADRVAAEADKLAAEKFKNDIQA